MNTALKHWKEAATVILAAGKRHRGVEAVCSAQVNGQSNLPDKSAFDYKVLLLKRSGKSGFMPNAFVFPGGLVESSDFSSEWLDIFKSFRRSPNFGLGAVKQPPETRPPIFATDRMKLGSPIPGDVAFRICAVRETFEESGVLLVVPKQDEMSLLKSIEDKRDGDQIQPALTTVNELLCDHNELAKWRLLVNENPSNFIRMCKELECLPNIWALHEWGNWLTPAGVYGKQRRYDTAFYICCLQETPHALQDEKEIVHLKWSTPPEVLHSFQARDMWIAPPQFYDLSRMCRHPSLESLHGFAGQRGSLGCERWLPVRLPTNDSYISVLPGDVLYPEDRSGQVDQNMSPDRKSLEEMDEERAAPFHRIVCLDPYTAAVHITITPKYNHLLPFSGPTLPSSTNSRL